MIKANEVRINNLVLYAGEVYRIDTIAAEYPTLYTDKFGIGVVDWNNIEPIPLTEELVFRLGFKKSFVNNTVFENKAGLVIANVGGSFVLTGYYSKNVVKIPYVHTLQNITLALTGYELTLTETK